MENRSLDNLFSGWYSQQYGSSGQTWGQRVDLANPNVSPTLSPVALEKPGDPFHGHNQPVNEGFGIEYDNGLQDGWSSNTILGCQGNCSFDTHAYVPKSETGIYSLLASSFGLDDETLEAAQGPSFVAHQYLIAGQSGGISESGWTRRPPLAIAENPAGQISTLDPGDAFNDVSQSFCTNYTGFKPFNVDMTMPYLTELTNEYNGSTNPPYNPCVDYQTIFDRLAHQILPPFLSWEYHIDNVDSFWAAMAIQHFVGPSGGPAVPEIVLDPDGTQFVHEAQTNNLPAVTYIVPCPYDSDHPFIVQDTNKTPDGPLWVASMLNAIGSSTALWNQTAVFVVWDDWGGWYDHVLTELSPFNVYNYGSSPPPNQLDPNEWGFRVPLLVISPYAKPGFVYSKDALGPTKHSYSSILNFIEWNWGLPSLNGDDLATKNAQGGPENLTEFFNFNQQPIPWQPISTGTYQPNASCPGGQ